MFPKIWLTLACLCSLMVSAQNQKEITAYFEQVIKGNISAQAPSGRLSYGQIEKVRKQVWSLWKQVNAEMLPTDLPMLDSLGQKTGVWLIPDSLEHHAAMPFYFGCKGTCPKSGYPFYLYLHGSGPKQQEWQTGLLLARRFADAPSVYFIPQIPNEGEWYRWWQRGKQWAWERLLRQLMLLDVINPNQLYVLGISEGGYGSQRLASFYADYWAAAGPMAGGEPLKNAPAENLSNVGFCLRTGANDMGFYRNKLTRYTAQALDSLEDLHPEGYRHKVELIPDRQHFIDYSPTTPWLSLFTRNPHPKHFIWEDFEMDGRHRTGFYNIKVLKRPDAVLRTRYDVNIHDNEVDISVENVHYTATELDPQWGIELKSKRTYEQASSGCFLLFLSEDQVDFSKLLTVRVNGQNVYRRKPSLNVQAMAESLATFSDPERIFPFVLKINL